MRSASSFSARCHKQAGIDILNFNRRYKTPHSGSGVGRMVEKQRYAMYVQKSTQKRTMPMCQYLANPTPKPTWWGHEKPTLFSLSLLQTKCPSPFSLMYIYPPTRVVIHTVGPCGPRGRKGRKIIWLPWDMRTRFIRAQYKFFSVIWGGN